MNTPIEPNVGLRLRALREQQGLSLRELAERCGLSFNAISRIERGENSPTVSTLHALAKGLVVPITAFFENSGEQTVVFTKRERRLGSSTKGVSMESLGVGLQNQHLEPFLVTLDPNSGTEDCPVSHSGEEFVHCLEGQLVYRINEEEYTLDPGDSLLFMATQPHSFRNPGEIPVQFFIVFEASEGRSSVGQPHLEG